MPFWSVKFKAFQKNCRLQQETFLNLPHQNSSHGGKHKPQCPSFSLLKPMKYRYYSYKRVSNERAFIQIGPASEGASREHFMLRIL